MNHSLTSGDDGEALDLEKEIDQYLEDVFVELFGPIDHTRPPYHGPARWHSFDLDNQALDALRHVSHLLPLAVDDPYLWKWIVIAMYDALHGFFGIALRRSDGAQLLSEKDEQKTYGRWAKQRSGQQIVQKDFGNRVDETRNLFKKIQDPSRMNYLGGAPLQPTEDQASCFEHLAHLRDKLTHYGHGSHSVFVGEIPTIVLACIEMIEWLFKESKTHLPKQEERSVFHELVQRIRNAAINAEQVYQMTSDTTGGDPPNTSA